MCGRAESFFLLLLTVLSAFVSGFWSTGSYPIPVQIICTILIGLPATCYLVFLICEP